MFKPERLYVPLGMDIAYQCDDGWVFDHDIYSNPIVYTTCNPDGKMYLHGEKRNWPNCIIRKIDFSINVLHQVMMKKIYLRNKNKFCYLIFYIAAFAENDGSSNDTLRNNTEIKFGNVKYISYWWLCA